MVRHAVDYGTWKDFMKVTQVLERDARLAASMSRGWASLGIDSACMLS